MGLDLFVPLLLRKLDRKLVAPFRLLKAPCLERVAFGTNQFRMGLPSEESGHNLDSL